MLVTGIIRKIDELGRIVIPKEIRKKLNIKIGDPLEISIIDNRKFEIRKHSPFNDTIELAKDLAESITKSSNKKCIITDKEKVIIATSKMKNEYEEKIITNKLIEILEKREIYLSSNKGSINIIENDSNKYTSQVIMPIIAGSDIIGSIILITINGEDVVKENEILTLKTVANFLGSKIEL